MGLLIDGKWVDQKFDPKATGGRFIRNATSFRNTITRDGSSGFKGESGRYHLYAALACPWAHRVLLMRKLKGLEPDISLTLVYNVMLENGWEFRDESIYTPDPLGHKYLYEVYQKAMKDYTGRATVPCLWDKRKQTIVSNESSELIVMLNSEFDCATNKFDYYPKHLKKDIDEINEFVYDKINNGVYKAGFAGSQEAHEDSARALFSALDVIEERLGRSRYLVGSQMTIADIRLFPTLIRFDSVYVGLFKCNTRRLEEYPNISNYLRDIYQTSGVAQTTDFKDIKSHYYNSIPFLNPLQIVPLGPEIDYLRPHDRAKFSS